MSLSITHYSVKSADIKAAALFELSEAAIDDEPLDGLSDSARAVLISDSFDSLVPILASSEHVHLNLLLAPLNLGMPKAQQKLWMDSIYEFYCANSTSLSILLELFPELTRRKHEKYMRRNQHLLDTKISYLTPEKETEVHTAFKELMQKYPDADIRETYMMLQERFIEVSMTTLIRQTSSYLPGSGRVLAAIRSKNLE